MGLFSSKSSSTQLQTTNQIDRRVVADNGGLGVSGDGNAINVLDGGAIAQAFDFAKLSDQETGRTLAGALGFAREVFDTGQKNNALVAQAYDQARGDATQKNLLIAVAVAAVAIVALKAFKL
jgi:hypothetical protein